MHPERGIQQELSIGQVISRTFEIFRHSLLKFFILYAIVEVIIAFVTTLASNAFAIPTPPASTNSTAQQVLSWVPRYISAVAARSLSIAAVSIVVGTTALGSAIKMTSDDIQTGQTDLSKALRFTFSKILWIWVLAIILGVIVGLGFIALIVPGVILAIMFCLAVPALLLENAGVMGSLGRSRELVGHRWGKTFATFLILIVVVIVASVIVGFIAGLFGPISPLISGVLGGFYDPLIPIALTVYYYSNIARMTPQSMPMSSISSTAGQMGAKFCVNCGAQLDASAAFCPKCGAKQPS